MRPSSINLFLYRINVFSFTSSISISRLFVTANHSSQHSLLSMSISLNHSNCDPASRCFASHSRLNVLSCDMYLTASCLLYDGFLNRFRLDCFRRFFDVVFSLICDVEDRKIFV